MKAPLLVLGGALFLNAFGMRSVGSNFKRTWQCSLAASCDVVDVIPCPAYE
jgi:hypothetical protein